MVPVGGIVNNQNQSRWARLQFFHFCSIIFIAVVAVGGENDKVVAGMRSFGKPGV
jgi:hypothetical protein